MTTYPFSAYLYRLKHIKRWSLMRSTMTENVAEHSYHVALLSHLLCSIGNELYGKKLNAERAASLALFHDAPEVFTGDIPTPVKHHNEDLLANFRQIEQMGAQRLTAMAPEPLQSVYAPLIGTSVLSDEDRELHLYVKAADRIDAYLKCAWEVAAGNREFAVAKQQTEEKLAESAMPEVEYFLKHMAPAFEMTLDELTAEAGDSAHRPEVR
ncbi:5'-deoxynucleotidase [Saccharibacillus sp. CPCC 101409]|uniref:5'-deoxynucleotidase n=1 Tax=Saccharibacillus sp. CPCC 101409 TaxID=3058041 RepID=UPI002672DFC8|nr:5'-deoxynucleotidase [Saccharibacillus sp. CPCC 101409]MDO3408863.1 5'-deoxynucleotidase [Saccharibacillus sp. CPCC 101409]